MAGASKRFKDEGYSDPKYMLPIGQNTLFDLSLLSFLDYFQSAQFLFIGLKNANNSGHFVKNRVSKLGIKLWHYIELPTPTKGQAETVKQGLDAFSVIENEPLLIFNIDTIRTRLNIQIPTDAAAWLEVFKAKGDHWSFAEVSQEEPNLVVRTSEKVRISNLCSTGLYYFKSCKLFKQLVESGSQNNCTGESYIAPLFNMLIKNNDKVYCQEVSSQDVILAGTPKEYESLIKSKIWEDRKFEFGTRKQFLT